MKRLLWLLVFLSWCSNAAIEIVSEEWPPYSYLNEKNEPSGLITERLINQLRQHQIAYNIRFLPWARAYHTARSEKNTLIFPISKNTERLPYFHWICPVYDYISVQAFSKKKRGFSNYTLTQLRQRDVRIGVMRGDNSYKHLLELGFKHENLDVSANEISNIHKLAANRVDVIFQSKESFDYRMKNLDYSRSDYVAGGYFA